MKTLPFLVILLVIPTLFFLSCDDDNGTVGPSPPITPSRLSDPSPADSTTDIDTSTVTLSWTCANPDSENLAFTLFWNSVSIPPGQVSLEGFPTVGTLTISQAVDSVIDLTTPSYTITDLYPGAHYEWRVTVYNDSGEVEIGPFWNFYTVDVIVQFADPNLESEVRQVVHKPEGDIYASDINTLGTFWGISQEITMLNGIQYMFGLEHICFRDNNISDLSPISELDWLGIVSLEHNTISDLSPLSGTPIYVLHLEHNQITDISPLAEMDNLASLFLNNNQISDISPLAEINLFYFISDTNQIVDISPLSYSTGLSRLSLNHNQITDISPLTGLTRIQTLYLNNNQITDVSPCTTIAWLHHLHLSHNQIADIEPLLSYAIHLEDLWLYGNPLDSLSLNVYIPELRSRGVDVYY